MSVLGFNRSSLKKRDGRVIRSTGTKFILKAEIPLQHGKEFRGCVAKKLDHPSGIAIAKVIRTYTRSGTFFRYSDRFDICPNLTVMIFVKRLSKPLNLMD